MIYPIVKYGDPVLEQEAEDVAEFGTPELDQFLEDMFESMYAAKGVGLAAPQIGFSRKIAVIDVSGGRKPRRQAGPDQSHDSPHGRQAGRRGGLPQHPRLPRTGETRRNGSPSARRTPKASSIEKTGEDLLARAFLHETDHLFGKLYISHISALKRDLIRRKVRKLVKAGDWT